MLNAGEVGMQTTMRPEQRVLLPLLTFQCECPSVLEV